MTSLTPQQSSCLHSFIQTYLPQGHYTETEQTPASPLPVSTLIDCIRHRDPLCCDFPGDLIEWTDSLSSDIPPIVRHLYAYAQTYPADFSQIDASDLKELLRAAGYRPSSSNIAFRIPPLDIVLCLWPDKPPLDPFYPEERFAAPDCISHWMQNQQILSDSIQLPVPSRILLTLHASHQDALQLLHQLTYREENTLHIPSSTFCQIQTPQQDLSELSLQRSFNLPMNFLHTWFIRRSDSLAGTCKA